MTRSFFVTGMTALVLLTSVASTRPVSATEELATVGDIRYAVVNADCTIARSLVGVTTCTKGGTGNYIIRFNRNVRNCAYNVTIGLAGASGTATPGLVTVAGAAVDVKGVFVTTDDIAGASSDRPFHLMVICR